MNDEQFAQHILCKNWYGCIDAIFMHYIGVAFDVRRLNVGDFTWIAREKASPIPGGSWAVTITLVFDDSHFCRSAWAPSLSRGCAGAYCWKEENWWSCWEHYGWPICWTKGLQVYLAQHCTVYYTILSFFLQFRLHNCGVRHPVYLIEEYGDSAHLKMPLRSLMQAVANTQVLLYKSWSNIMYQLQHMPPSLIDACNCCYQLHNTCTHDSFIRFSAQYWWWAPNGVLIQVVLLYLQVIDGFHVKTTADIRESVAYLTIMTRALQKHYAVSIPPAD